TSRTGISESSSIFIYHDARPELPVYEFGGRNGNHGRFEIVSPVQDRLLPFDTNPHLRVRLKEGLIEAVGSYNALQFVRANVNASQRSGRGNLRYSRGRGRPLR